MGNTIPKASGLLVLSPLSGWTAPLSEVPDAVFSEGILGDGVAIDPTSGVLCAPCDGVVIQAAKHAVTLRAGNGAEILMHVGLDTVALDGQGFRALAREGQHVTVGQALLEFDLEFLAPRAKSLISPIVIVNGAGFTITRRTQDAPVVPGSVLMEITPTSAVANIAVAGAVITRQIQAALPHGLHARPAARLADIAKGFSAECVVVRQGRRASGRSVSALMALGVRHGDAVLVEAQGADAEDAIAALAQMLSSGAGEEAAPAAISQTMPVADSRTPAAMPGVLMGVRAAPGIALEGVVVLRAGDIALEEQGMGVALETAQLRNAVMLLCGRLREAAGGHGGDILLAHIALLEDPQIEAMALEHVGQGKSAGFAMRHALRAQAEIFRAMDDARMRERAADLLDLERQLLALLAGQAPARMVLPGRAIVVADELLPSEFLALDRSHVAGIATARGGPTSHVAILAAASGIPMLVGLGEALNRVSTGTQILLDADAGLLRLNPDEATAKAARAKMAALAQARARDLASAARDCRTADGMRIEVFANLGGDAQEAAGAVALGAEGCGLLRTEFLFMERQTPPGEQEQFETYQAIADALDGRPLILRSFDIGGDKPAPYLQFPTEDNPMMGLRGIRAGFHWPELLRTQLAAALRVRPVGLCRIMLPMVSSVAEVRQVRALIQELCAGRAQTPHVGIMVETPAAALMADHLAAEADFLSIGTNDLTQYVLAMDRGNALLAGQIDALHPAVLQLIARTAAAGAAAGKPVGVCGGLAADAAAAPLLVGLGISELSMPPVAIAAVKAMVGSVTMAQCRQAAEQALRLDTAAAVRALLQERFGGQA